MNAFFASIIPFLVIILVTLIFNELRYSLIIAILITAYTLHMDNYSELVSSIALKCYDFLQEKDNFFLYLFLISIPALITLLIETKTAQAFAFHLINKFKSKKKVSYATCIASILLSIDDYFSILTVGTVLRPVFDTMGIARAKLAFFIHALSGPIVIMIPLSSWVATITTFLHQSGVQNIQSASTIILQDPFSTYLYAIPHITYSLLTLITVFFIINKNISYGPMHESEKNTLPTIIFEDQQNVSCTTNKGYELLYSFILLLGMIIVGILYVGRYWLFGGQNSLIEACTQSKNIFVILCFSSITTFFLSSIYFVFKRRIFFCDIPTIIYKGYKLMEPVLQMIFLTSILSAFLKNELKTGFYLAEYINQCASIEYIPVGFFIIGFLISLATGSSWTTFGILLPIAIPTVAGLTTTGHLATLLYPTLGALFSGGLCGDHISPFSETTIMAAHSAFISPQEHTKTQIPYAFPVIIGCCLYFITAGLTLHYAWYIQYSVSMAFSILVTIGLLTAFNKNHD